MEAEASLAAAAREAREAAAMAREVWAWAAVGDSARGWAEALAAPLVEEMDVAATAVARWVAVGTAASTAAEEGTAGCQWECMAGSSAAEAMAAG